MVSALQAAIRMAWVISLVSVSSFTMAGLCRASGIFAGTALAAAVAAASSRRAAATGRSSLASAWLVMIVLVPGAGWCRAASLSWRAAAVFFAGFGTSRPGSSGVTA